MSVTDLSHADLRNLIGTGRVGLLTATEHVRY